MNIIFQINGGIGKCVAATAVCEAIKKQYPDSKLIVVSGYADVFLNNPHVYRAFNFGGFSYFYEEYIENKEFKIFAHDPYQETGHIMQNESLIESWCKLFNLPYNNEQPKIYLTAREITFFESKYYSDKPILLIQPNGGGDTNSKYSWARDIPFKTMNQVIEEFRGDYNIVHIKREDQVSYDHTFPVSDSFRSLCVLVSMSSKRLFIDSFAQHVAAGMNLPSTVCWIANKPEVFGYKINNNIVSNPFTVTPELRNAYLGKFNIGGDLLEFPYNNEDEIFNTKDIINSIKNIKFYA
jgi:ADP-heptose:LPS heptosyltransferase